MTRPGADEHLARRFDPSDPSHVDNIAYDEGTGTRHLRAGALRFDEDGCSVFRIEQLQAQGLTMYAIITDVHRGLATTSVARITDFDSGLGSGGREFDVSASPLSPPPEYAPAHASITHDVTLYSSKTKCRQARRDLASRAFDVVADQAA